jgi:hypothetical protein
MTGHGPQSLDMMSLCSSTDHTCLFFVFPMSINSTTSGPITDTWDLIQQFAFLGESANTAAFTISSYPEGHFTPHIIILTSIIRVS